MRALRDLLDERPSVATESALEALTWRLLLDGGLPRPERQYEIFGSGGRLLARVDFAYPEARVAIEADGYAFHSDPADWQRDRTRQNALTAMGWAVFRVTWADVTRRGRAVVREIARLLAERPILLDRIDM
ncbi:MAG: endonuclease domain-containing protein [Actinomycetota bacterium]